MFTAAKNFFEIEVHRVCIPNYKIEEGIMIMVISAVASRNFDAISIQQSHPFIKFSGDFNKDTENIIKAWTELVSLIKIIIDKRIDNKIESYLYILNEYSKDCEDDEKRYVKNAIKAADDFVNHVRSTLSGIQKFIGIVKSCKNHINFYASEAAALSYYSAKNIIHYVMNKD